MGLSNDIIKQIEKGKQPFKLLYDEYYVQLFRFIYQRVESVDIAKDIISETFITVYQKLHLYKDIGKSFDSWLYKIGYNHIISYYRKEKKARFIGLTEVSVKYIANEFSVEETIINEDFIHHLFKELTDEEIEFISMRYIEGRPFKEIAEIFDMQEGAVKMKIYRILSTLKELKNLQ